MARLQRHDRLRFVPVSHIVMATLALLSHAVAQKTTTSSKPKPTSTPDDAKETTTTKDGPKPTIASVASYQDLGCFADSDTRILDADGYRDSVNMTPELCRDYCALHDFAVFGVEAGDECHCGDALAEFALEVPRQEEACGYSCPGEEGKACGGDWRMNAYSATVDLESVKAGARPSLLPTEINGVDRKKNAKGGYSPGVVAGTAIGSVAGVLALAGSVFFFCFHRRREERIRKHLAKHLDMVSRVVGSQYHGEGAQKLIQGGQLGWNPTGDVTPVSGYQQQPHESPQPAGKV